MRKRNTFGLLGILAFAGFALSCYTGTELISPHADINRSELMLLAPSSDKPYDYRNSYTLVVTLRPRTVLSTAQIEWYSDDDGVVFVKQDTRRPSSGFGGNGRATVTIVGYDVGTVEITARVSCADGSFDDIELSSIVVVVEP